MIDPDLKVEYFHAFTQCVEGCAPDALKSLRSPGQAFISTIWTIEMQTDHLLEGFDITAQVDEDILDHWEVLEWDARRTLVGEWADTCAYPI